MGDRYSVFPKPVSLNRTLSVYTTASIESRSPSLASTRVPIPSRPSSRPPSRPRSATHSIASTIGNITLGGEQQTEKDHQEIQWPLRFWHGGDDGTFPRAPYESYIDYLTERWPHLSELQDWMSNSNKNPKRHKTRLYKLGTTVLDFREAAAPIRREFPDDTGSKDTGSGFNHLSICLHRSTPATVKGRMIIVPYLVPSLVNVLGSVFDIDPEFFHEHLGLPSHGNPGTLPSDPFVRITYNIDLSPENGGVVGMTEERRFSVFVHIPKDSDGHWTSIILLNTPDMPMDSTSTTTLAPIRSRNPLRRPKFSKGPSIQQDLFHEYVQTILDQPPDEHKFWATDPFFGLNQLFSHAVREWAGTLTSLGNRLRYLEQDISGQHDITDDAGHELKRRDPLPALRSLRSTLVRYESMLSSQLETVETGGCPEWKALKISPTSTRDRFRKPNMAVVTLERDYTRILRQSRDLIAGVDAATSLLTARWSVLLSHKGLQHSELAVEQAQNVQTLLRLTLVLLPLMLVTNLFSMNIDDLKPLFKPVVFLAISLGFTVIVVLVVMICRPLAAWIQGKRRDRRRETIGVGISSEDYSNSHNNKAGRIPVASSTRTSGTAVATSSGSWDSPTLSKTVF